MINNAQANEQPTPQTQDGLPNLHGHHLSFDLNIDINNLVNTPVEDIKELTHLQHLREHWDMHKKSLEGDLWAAQVYGKKPKPQRHQILQHEIMLIEKFLKRLDKSIEHNLLLNLVKGLNDENKLLHKNNELLKEKVSIFKSQLENFEAATLTQKNNKVQPIANHALTTKIKKNTIASLLNENDVTVKHSKSFRDDQASFYPKPSGQRP